MQAMNNMSPHYINDEWREEVPCIELLLEQHEESEYEWTETPGPQWLYKTWNVIDEQVTLDDVVECIANSIEMDFACFAGDFSWGGNECSFVATVDGEPLMFTVSKDDVATLNACGDFELRPLYECSEDARRLYDEYLNSLIA